MDSNKYQVDKLGMGQINNLGNLCYKQYISIFQIKLPAYILAGIGNMMGLYLMSMKNS